MKEVIIKEKAYESNGVKVYSCTNNNLHTFSLCCYIKAGMLYDGKTEPGTAHVFEHMVFRNLKSKYENDIYELLVANKLSFNATTYNEFVQFEFSGHSDGFSFACQLIRQMFEDFSVSGEEYKSELDRVKAEIRENSDKTTISYFADSKVWHGTNLEGTICGSCADVNKISQKKLNGYKNKIISKGNFFFYVTGNVSEENINELLKSIKSIRVSEKFLDRDNTVILPCDFGNRKREVYVKNSDCCYVRISFDTDNCTVPFAVQDIIYSALFTDADALVYQNLSERNPYVYSYDSTYEQYKNAGCIKLQFEVSSRKLYDALAEAVNIFNSVKMGGFSLNNALNKLEMKQLAELDSPESLNFVLAFENHILRDREGTSADFSVITKEDVCRCASSLFVPQNCVIAIKGDKKKVDCKRITEIIDRLNCHDFGDYN